MNSTEQDIETRVAECVRERNWKRLAEELEGLPVPEIADLLSRLDKPDRVLFFRSLPRPTATAVFSELSADRQDALATDLTDVETRHLLADMDPDNRTQFLEELPGQAIQRMVNLLSPEDLREARWLLGYPEDSVGRLMTPDYVAVRPHWTVETALRHVRRRGQRVENVQVVYVVDEEWRLLDALDLSRLVLAELDESVADVMDYEYTAISAVSDREEAVDLMRRYDLVALPVVDTTGVMLGVVTVDDILDVASEEATEDFHKLGSVEPIQTSLLEASAVFLYRRRIGWLLSLVLVNVVSGAAIGLYEDTILASVSLVFFLPVLIASGGNAGAQSATLMIRALATGDVRPTDWVRLAFKEASVALIIGLTMAFAVSVIGVFRAPDVVGVVAVTMMLIVLLGSLLGMSLPFVLLRLGRDPAAASAPLVTSLADILGVLIYFSMAKWYLEL